jgi:hypothetical protein
MTYYRRTDIIFDRYIDRSLKTAIRYKRGKGSRRRVTITGSVPRNWIKFIQNAQNKSELFELLADVLVEVDSDDGKLVVAKNENTLSNCDTFHQPPCTHEEADTRIFVHLKNAIQEDNIESATVLSNDTDISVIAAATFNRLCKEGLQQIWVACGLPKKRRWIPIHELVAALGPSKSKVLAFFHAVTGCDNVSGIRGKGKTLCWQTWCTFSEATDVFAQLSSPQASLDVDLLTMVEKFFILLFHESSGTDNIDTLRKELFTKKNKQFDSIPPTRDALWQIACEPFIKWVTSGVNPQDSSLYFLNQVSGGGGKKAETGTFTGQISHTKN